MTIMPDIWQTKMSKNSRSLHHTFSMTAKTEAIATLPRYRQDIKEVRNKLERKIFERSILGQLKKKSPWNYEHCLRVERLAVSIGKVLEVCGDELDDLAAAVRLHDVGKIRIPEKILEKPGSLTESEKEIMVMHAEYGYRIIDNSGLYNKTVMNAVREHHVHFTAMSGPTLLTEIIQAADCADAMMMKRPYKAPMSRQKVIAEFEGNTMNMYREVIQIEEENLRNSQTKENYR